jgi:hypothetical protein
MKKIRLTLLLTVIGLFIASASAGSSFTHSSVRAETSGSGSGDDGGGSQSQGCRGVLVCGIPILGCWCADFL